MYCLACSGVVKAERGGGEKHMAWHLLRRGRRAGAGAAGQSPWPSLLVMPPLLLLLTATLSAAAAACPAACRCATGAASCTRFSAASQLAPPLQHLRFLNASCRRVDFFSLRRLPGLLTLHVVDSGVVEVTGTGKALPGLRMLDLSGNALHVLHAFAFRDFPALASLNLSANGVHTVAPSALLLPALTTLDLRNNRLTVLKAHYFSDTPRLQELYLSNNLISRVPSFVFAHNLNVLDLSGNHIIRLEESAFEGINITFRLNLGQNALRRVPNLALKRLGHTQSLILDGNPFHILSSGSFVGLAVKVLSLSHHRNLHLVHKESFVNMIELEALNMTDNPALTYFHPQSLVNVPHLSFLNLSNNALFTLEADLFTSAPNLTELYVRNNSFTCHCSLGWLRNRTKDDVFCLQKTNGTIEQLPIPQQTNSCIPYIIPLFPTTYHEVLGNNVSFHCRALGTPDIKVHWFSKSGERLYNGQCVKRFCVADHILTLHYLHHEDSGSYTCIARNSAGVDTRVVTLEVRDVNVHLFPLTVASTFVTLAWNMSNSISNNYMLRYDEKKGASSAASTQTVTFSVGMKMHSYTVHGLNPGTTYSFSLCIQREEYTIVISSTTVTTREEDFLLTLGIERSYLSVILVSIIMGVFLASCLGLCGLRCWRQRLKLRKSESGLSGHSILQSSSTHSDMACITYINLSDVEQSIESNLMGYA